MLNMYIGELFKFYKHRLFLITLIFILVIYTLVFLLQYVALIRDNAKTPASMLINITFPYLYFYSVLVASILVLFFSYMMICSMVGNEYGWNTLKTIAMRGTGKLDFLNSKILAVLTYAVFFTFCGALVTSIWALLFQSKILSNAIPDQVIININPFFVIVSFIIFLIMLLPYLGLGIFCTVLTKSPGGGFGIGLAYILIVENLLPNLWYALSKILGDWVNEIPHYSLGAQIKTISSADLFSLNSEKEYLLQISESLLISLIYAIVFYLVSVFIIRKRDILN